MGFVPLRYALELGVCAVHFATAVDIPVGVLAVKRFYPESHGGWLLALTGLFNAYLLVVMILFDHAGSVHWNCVSIA